MYEFDIDVMGGLLKVYYMFPQITEGMVTLFYYQLNSVLRLVLKLSGFFVSLRCNYHRWGYHFAFGRFIHSG